MKSLAEIGARFGTDKETAHHYLSLYELLFQRISSQPYQRVLEIGIQFGNSLKTWQDYFWHPIITGIDSVDNGVHIDKIEVIIGDAYAYEMIDKLRGREFDLIIEDGSHEPEHQVFTIKNYLQFLSYRGILIIEDVRTKGVIPLLKQALPEGYQYTAVDMTEGDSIVDSRLFIAWKS